MYKNHLKNNSPNKYINTRTHVKDNTNRNLPKSYLGYWDLQSFTLQKNYIGGISPHNFFYHTKSLHNPITFITFITIYLFHFFHLNNINYI